MSEHTKGPWIKGRPKRCKTWCVGSTQEFHGGACPSIAESIIREEDACLISAAPELLVACEAAIECCGPSQCWGGHTRKFLELIESAITKAKGERP